MKLYSYVVARDFGFAPNPFYGMCTLATCKPITRRVANVGDWIVGTGSSKNGKQGYLVYIMQVGEMKTFNEYWENIKYVRKKPNLGGSKKLAFGDNIYFKNSENSWHQADSHHSYDNGKPNIHNIENDTQTNRVLISTDFTYWGGSGPLIPNKFRNYLGYDICAIRHHKCNFPSDLVTDFITWYRSLLTKGYVSPPLDWSSTA